VGAIIGLGVLRAFRKGYAPFHLANASSLLRRLPILLPCRFLDVKRLARQSLPCNGPRVAGSG
jgi:hypothetical protein